MDAEPDLLSEAENVAECAAGLGIELVVIGALALAAHNYVRTTEDVDLAGVIDPVDLMQLGEELQKAGYVTELREADAQDPLGGVLDIRASSGLVQVISFAGKFPAVIRDACQRSHLVLREESSLRILPLPHLIVLKLYAGGFKSKADIIEVLSRNPEEDLDAIEALCSRYRVRGFDEIRQELDR